MTCSLQVYHMFEEMSIVYKECLGQDLVQVLMFNIVIILIMIMKSYKIFFAMVWRLA